MVDVENPRLEAALSLARRGFRIHPLRPKSKKAMLDGWMDLATTNEEQIRFWWERTPTANVGIYLTRDTRVLVVDVDTKNDGDRVFSFLSERLPFPPTMTVRTPSGGLHLYYRFPFSRIGRERINFAPGVDILVDRNVVAASSETLDGVYAWEDTNGFGGDREPVDAPGWLVDMMEDYDMRARLPQVATKGSRNEAVNSHGFVLKAHDTLRPDSVKAAMILAGLNSCDPPYPDIGDPEEVNELDGTIRSVQNSTPDGRQADNPRWEDTVEGVMQFATLDDQGNFMRLQKISGDRLRFWSDGSNSTWFHWNEVFWQKTDQSVVQMYARMINSEVISLAQARIRQARLRGEEDDGALALLRWGQALRNKKNINRLISYAEDEPAIRVQATDFDSNDYLVGARNFTLNLREGHIGWMEPDPSLMISKQLGTSYDPDAACPQWERFVLDVMSGDEEMVRYLQRAVGYSLTGSTDEQVLFMLVGGGANGKSVFLRVISALMGDYGATTSFNTFDYDTRSSIPDDLAALRGVRFVYATEREDERRLAEGRVKLVTGGDEISARHLYGRWFTFRPRFKVWLAVNQLPLIVGDDDGIWRRLQVIDFNESYLGREDKRLADKLLTELPGILNWALDGLSAWYERELDPPPRVVANTAAYRTDMDTLGLFVQERLVETNNEDDKETWISAAAMYRVYRDWCSQNGHRPYSKRKLTRQLKTRLPLNSTAKFRGQTHWVGVAFRDIGDILDNEEDAESEYELPEGEL